jgi:glycosyltransferase involved in cell wall biosynthesis
MFNPSPKRGLPFFAQLAEQLGVRRPDIPLLVVESSKSAGSLARFGLAGGFDLRRHESIRVSPTGWRRSHIYGATRVLLAPYLFGLEGLGASVAEALANGIPPIASNRGALPEICNGGGCCLPIPSAITAVFPVPVEPSAVEPWVELISRLADDPSFYRAESERAAAAGARYRPDLVARQYGDFLSCVLTSPPSVKGDLA